MTKEISLVEKVFALWGWPRAARVVDAYKIFFQQHPELVRDLAMFCNAGAPIAGASEFDRGVEEGKRRVWLHLARMSGLEHVDFVEIADGTRITRMRS